MLNKAGFDLEHERWLICWPTGGGRRSKVAPFAQVVVPDHKELDRGTLRAIIRQAGLSVDEFARLL